MNKKLIRGGLVVDGTGRKGFMAIEWIYPGHNETVKGVGILAEVASDMDAILSGSSTNYELVEDGYRSYSFPNDVIIVTRDADTTTRP